MVYANQSTELTQTANRPGRWRSDCSAQLKENDSSSMAGSFAGIIANKWFSTARLPLPIPHRGTSYCHNNMHIQQMSSTCPFCTLPPLRIINENSLALMIRDGYPVSSGHTLIIPKRHVTSFFEITIEEQENLFVLLNHAQAQLRDELHPDGFNIGINDGSAAGQTVPHLHIHLIPRFIGDTPDPRGGIRWALPATARYWSD